MGVFTKQLLQPGRRIRLDVGALDVGIKQIDLIFIFECMRACPNLVAGPVYTQNKVLAAATAVNSTAATAAPP